MDIVFKCPHCDQELEVDASGAGSAFDCPSCGNSVTIPAADGADGEAAPAPVRPATGSVPPAAPPPEEHHYSVPVHEGPAEALIKKAAKPLVVAAKESDRKMRIKTFKRSDCQEVGRDRFDEIVSEFLDKVGQPNIVSINPITYSMVEMGGSHATVNDYGVLIVYRG